jgi:hypothetical protein
MKKATHLPVAFFFTNPSILEPAFPFSFEEKGLGDEVVFEEKGLGDEVVFKEKGPT